MINRQPYGANVDIWYIVAKRYLFVLSYLPGLGHLAFV